MRFTSLLLLCTATVHLGAASTLPKDFDATYVLVGPVALLAQQISTAANVLRFSATLVTIKETFWCAAKNQI
ncbi:hypothetical protein MCOR27_011420 [Pyricularia oryzae]|nr:hypothetical protein MCOR27_011420 [Pyricularia oryzae]